MSADSLQGPPHRLSKRPTVRTIAADMTRMVHSLRERKTAVLPPSSRDVHHGVGNFRALGGLSRVCGRFLATS